MSHTSSTALQNNDVTLKPVSTTRKEWHVFPPALASAISKEQPDIAAAILLYGLSTWLPNNYSQLRIEGRQYCTRSLSELAEDHPYFTDKGIGKIIKRAEAKGFLYVRRDRHKLLFSLPESVRDMCRKRKGHIYFKVDDAVRYGEKAAICLANLQWQVKSDLPCIEDEFDRHYYPLGPQKLSNHLPFSRWTVARILKELKDAKVLVEHPTEEHYYTRNVVVSEAETSKSARAEVDHDVADVEREVAGVGDNQITDINIDSNEDGKWYSSAPLAPASPAQEPRISPGLSEVVDQALQRAKSAPMGETDKYRVIAVDDDGCEEYLEVDANNYPDEGYLYDITPNLQLWNDHIDFQTEQMVDSFRLNKVACTKDDERVFRQLFFDNPDITADHLIPVLTSCRRLRERRRVSGITVGDDYQKVEDSSCLTFPKRVDSARYFLYRLPEIITQLSGDSDDDDDLLLKSINYMYLGKERVNKVVQLKRQ